MVAASWTATTEAPAAAQTAWGHSPEWPPDPTPEPTPIPTPEPHEWNRDDMLRALEGQPAMTHRIIYCECHYDPQAIRYRADGSPLFLGCGQLMTGRGNGYDIFLRWGYSDWRDPYQVVAFINEVQARGMLASQYPNTRFGCTGSP